jgi:hypothetical protein
MLTSKESVDIIDSLRFFKSEHAKSNNSHTEHSYLKALFLREMIDWYNEEEEENGEKQESFCGSGLWRIRVTMSAELSAEVAQ